MKRFFAAIIFASALVLTLGSCRHKAAYRTFSGSVWATTFHITYCADRALDDSILPVMRAVELSLSPFEPQSTVSLVNSGQSSATDPMMRRIITSSAEINRLSHGAFDPTVAPLVNLWGFGYDNAKEPPTQERIDSALQLVGIRRVSIDADADTLRRPAGMTFDFSAITKGYGCDLIGEMLRRNGCGDFMVEIGGEIALSGHNDRGEKWHIQIDAPVEGSAPGQEGAMVVALTDCGVATSGNYRNFRPTADGGKVWHTISPVTGRPAESPTLSATVIAHDCMTADALATASMAMQPAEALEMIEAVPGASVLLITAAADGSLSFTTSSRFPKAE